MRKGPIFQSQVRKGHILRTQILTSIKWLRTQFWASSSAPVNSTSLIAGVSFLPQMYFIVFLPWKISEQLSKESTIQTGKFMKLHFYPTLSQLVTIKLRCFIEQEARGAIYAVAWWPFCWRTVLLLFLVYFDVIQTFVLGKKGLLSFSAFTMSKSIKPLMFFQKLQL